MTPNLWTATPGSRPRLRDFVFAEVKGVWYASFRPFWTTGAVTAALLILGLGILVFGSSPPSEANSAAQEPSWVSKLVVVVGFSLFYAVWVGLIAGVVGVLWRLVGIWVVVPFILIPLAILLSLWLCSGWLAAEAAETGAALVQSAANHGLPETSKALSGGKLLHGAAIGVFAIVLVLLTPFLVIDAFWILLDANFLWQFAQFVLAFFLALALGVIPSMLVSLAVLSVAVVRRLLARYRHFMGGFPVVNVV
jgi:hypothetical protein